MLNKIKVIYEILCKNCHLIYRSETEHKISKMLNQHKSDIQNKPKASGFAKHNNESLNEPDYDDVIIFNYENNEQPYPSFPTCALHLILMFKF